VGYSSLTQVFDGKILSAKIRFGLIAGKWGGGHLEVSFKPRHHPSFRLCPHHVNPVNKKYLLTLSLQAASWHQRFAVYFSPSAHN
jgi:hypothetical protein